MKSLQELIISGRCSVFLASGKNHCVSFSCRIKTVFEVHFDPLKAKQHYTASELYGTYSDRLYISLDSFSIFRNRYNEVSVQVISKSQVNSVIYQCNKHAFCLLIHDTLQYIYWRTMINTIRFLYSFGS